jgi:hypothetical protein
VAVAIGLASGCGQSTDGTGAVEISVQALSVTDVGAVEVLIAGPNLPTPLAQSLSLQSDGSWNRFIGNIPAATGLVFSASAYGAADPSKALYEGTVMGVTIEPNRTASITIVLQEISATAGFGNHAPVIDGFTVSSKNLFFGDTAAVHLTAHDADNGETAGLTIDAHADCGTLASLTDSISSDGHRIWSSRWTAPEADGSCAVRFVVTDVHGATVAGIVTFLVSGSVDGGGARVNTLFASYPTIFDIAATPLPPALLFAPGGAVTLDVVATQPAVRP